MQDQSGAFAGCNACVANRLNLCPGISVAGASAESALARPVAQTAWARRTISSAREWSDYVHVICSGWAMVSMALPDGRRQILSFLLPGEIDSTVSLFVPRFGRTIEAITEVSYRRFKREAARATVFREPELLETLGKIWSDERAQADHLAVDLGRRTADERIARLILDLAERLARRGMMEGDSMDFPLRQRQIADATGLTSVHVSRVLVEFQRAELIKLAGRRLTILNRERLRSLAEGE